MNSKTKGAIQTQLNKFGAVLVARERKRFNTEMLALGKKTTNITRGNAVPVNEGAWYEVIGDFMAPTVNDGDRVDLDLGAPMERGGLMLFSGPKGYFLRRWNWDKVDDRLVYYVYGDKNPSKIRMQPKNWIPTRVKYCLPKGHPLPEPGVWNPEDYPLKKFPSTW